MQASVENTSALGRRLTVAVPFKRVAEAEEQKLNEISKEAEIAGFRKGKAPKTAVQQRYKSRILQQALEQIIDESLPKALAETKLVPVANPVIEKVIKENGKDLQYIVNFEVYPEIKLLPWGSISVTQHKAVLAESDIDAMLKKLTEQFADWKNVEGPTKLTDRITVDYTSTLDGKPYENGAAQDVVIELGSHQFIEGFEEGLVAARTGDTRTLNLTFPANWRMEELANKPVQFKVTIKSIQERVPSALNETFAKKIGAPSSEVAAIRQHVKHQLEQQALRRSEEKLKEDTKDALLKANDIPLPKSLIEREAAMLHEDLHRRMGNKAETQCQHKGLEEEAEKRVALGLILRQVVQEQKLVPNQERVKDRIKQISLQFSSPEVVEGMYYESEELMNGVTNTVLVEQAMDYVVSKINIKEDSITLEELLKGRRN